MWSIEALWADQVGMSVCHYIIPRSTLGYLVLPHSMNVQLFVYNLSDIHFIIPSCRAEFNEICILFYVILYMMTRNFL
jgi:hypothetical protein